MLRTAPAESISTYSMRLETTRRSPVRVTPASWMECSRVEQHARRGAGVALVHQNCSTLKEVAIALQRQVDDGIEQRVAGANKGGQRLALRRDESLLEGDALVARKYRFADTNEPVAITYWSRNMGNFVATRLPLLGAPPSLLNAS